MIESAGAHLDMAAPVGVVLAGALDRLGMDIDHPTDGDDAPFGGITIVNTTPE